MSSALAELPIIQKTLARDHEFSPQFRLQGPDGVSLIERSTTVGPDLSMRVSLSGTYNRAVLVTNRESIRRSAPSNYILTVAKTPGP